MSLIKIPNLGERELLAKWRESSDPDPLNWNEARGWLYRDHVEECLLTAQVMLDESEFGPRLHDVMDLDLPYEEFRRLVLLSVLTHDLGKANSEFQTMLWLKEEIYQKYQHDPKNLQGYLDNLKFKQMCRHEWLSAGILQIPVYRDWLLGACFNNPTYAHYVTAAAAGHHLKTHRERDEKRMQEPLYIYFEALHENISSLCLQFGLPDFPKTNEPSRKTLQECEDLIEDYSFNTIKSDKLSYALKWCTIFADSLGSTTPPKKYKQLSLLEFRDHIKQAITYLSKPPLPWDVRTKIHQKEGDSKSLTNPKEFQNEAYRSDGDVIFCVSCGGGKTSGIFLAAGGKDYICHQRLIVTFPTTMTAAECRFSYGTDNDDLNTSRASVDAEILQECLLPPTPDEDPATEREDKQEAIDALAILRRQSSEVTYATVDQVLGLLTYSRKSVIWLPCIINSIIAFDEVHSYDTRMYFWFEHFLKFFPKIRMIAATATLAKHQEETIKKARSNIQIITTKHDKSDPSYCDRYRFHIIDQTEASKFFQKGTLWIVNRVGVAQEIGQDFPDALVYHARFRYKDRAHVHRKFMDAFKHGGPRAVATQVAEISLDISSKSMITEVCDPAAIIQRIGRLTERGRPPSKIGDCYIYMPTGHRPYLKHDMERWYEWAKQLEGKVWNQIDLHDFMQIGVKEKREPLDLLDVTDTYRQDLRGVSYMSSAVLESDLEEIKKKPYGIQAWSFSIALSDTERAQYGNDQYRYHYVLPFSNDLRLGISRA